MYQVWIKTTYVGWQMIEDTNNESYARRAVKEWLASGFEAEVRSKS